MAAPESLDSLNDQTIHPAQDHSALAEVAKFEAFASDWWNPTGKFRPLHKINPARLDFIHKKSFEHFGLEQKTDYPLKGLTILDVGCGGGLLCEPLARNGARVTGIDLGARNIGAAKSHAAARGLDIAYHTMSIDQVVQAKREFDLVLNMEVVEHVADPERFLHLSASAVSPGGMMIVATLNRTLKAFGLAILGAEYLLGWLPHGTHEFEKFLRPDEIRSILKPCGLTLEHPQGLTYQPLSDRWRLTSDTSVNYMIVAKKTVALAEH